MEVSSLLGQYLELARLKSKRMLGPVTPGMSSSRQGSQITLKAPTCIPGFISSVVQSASAGSSVLTEPVKNGRATGVLTECAGS